MNKRVLFVKGKELLEDGDIILAQTDTVIGLMADARNNNAIEKINNLKKAPTDKVRQIILATVEQIPLYANITPRLMSKLNRLLPGPYTFILNANPDYSLANLTIKDGKIGIRVPYAPTLLKFIDYYGAPLAATSANLYGNPAPVNFKEVNDSIISKVELYLPELKANLSRNFFKHPQGGYYASAIIDLTSPKPKILRNHPLAKKAMHILNN